jgi:CysZ protein
MLSGLRAFIGGIGFVVGSPSLWGYALVPMFMVLILGIGFGCLGVWGAGRAGTALLGEVSGFWAMLGYWLLWGSLALVALVTSLALALALAQPLSGFALDAIMRAQERALRSDYWMETTLLRSLIQMFIMLFFATFVGLVALTGLFIVNVLFPPAVVVTLPLKFLICGWLLAWNYLDYPLSRRGLGIGERLAWVRRHFGAFSAFGLAWMALLLGTIGLGLLFLPMGVAGATRLVVLGERIRA